MKKKKKQKLHKFYEVDKGKLRFFYKKNSLSFPYIISTNYIEFASGGPKEYLSTICESKIACNKITC